MFAVEKYKWLTEQMQGGTLLRVNTTSGYDIAIHTVSFEKGRIKANDRFDITDITVYGFNAQYQTIELRYPEWKDSEYYYQDNFEWRAIKK